MSASRARAAARAEACLSSTELAAAAGISHVRLAQLVNLGLIEPTEPGGSDFTSVTVVRLRRMLRLRRELHVNLIGATIILDLLERLDRLESELARERPGTNE